MRSTSLHSRNRIYYPIQKIKLSTPLKRINFFYISFGEGWKARLEVSHAAVNTSIEYILILLTKSMYSFRGHIIYIKVRIHTLLAQLSDCIWLAALTVQCTDGLGLV